jgi:hypothetical protein
MRCTELGLCKYKRYLLVCLIFLYFMIMILNVVLEIFLNMKGIWIWIWKWNEYESDTWDWKKVYGYQNKIKPWLTEQVSIVLSKEVLLSWEIIYLSKSSLAKRTDQVQFTNKKYQSSNLANYGVLNGSILHNTIISVNCIIIVVVTCIRGNDTLSCALLKIHTNPIILGGADGGIL